MRRRHVNGFAATVLILSALAALAPAAAQEPQTKGRSAAEQAANPTPLKVTVVISRYQGEKQISNLPFMLTLNTNARTSLRMGADVPVPGRTVKEGTAESSYSYRPIGTQIDCSAAFMTAEGRVPLTLTVNDSQVSIETSPDAGPMRGLPRFTNFTSTATLSLADGGSMEYTAATDKTTGEVVRVSVSMTVLK